MELEQNRRENGGTASCAARFVFAGILERETSLELATSTLARLRSTN